MHIQVVRVHVWKAMCTVTRKTWIFGEKPGLSIEKPGLGQFEKPGLSNLKNLDYRIENPRLWNLKNLDYRIENPRFSKC